MLDVFKSIGGASAQAINEQAEGLHLLIARAREERGALNAVLDVVAIRGAKMAPLSRQLEQVTEEAEMVSRRVEEISARLATLDNRTSELELVDARIRGLSEAVADAERAAREAVGPDSEVHRHRVAVEHLADQARETQSTLEVLTRERTGLDELRGQLRTTGLEIEEGLGRAGALRGEVNRIGAITASLEEDHTTLRDGSRDIKEAMATVIATLEQVESRLQPLTQLEESTQVTEERLRSVHALCEHVTQKSKALEHQQQLVEHAVVQTNRVAEMVWAMDLQISSLNEGLKRADTAEETIRRIEKLSAETAARLAQAAAVREQTENETALLKTEARGLLDATSGQIETLAVRKKEFETFDERVRGLQGAIGAAESQMVATSARENQVAALARQIDGVTRHFDTLVAQADDLARKQLAFEHIHEQFSQVNELAKHSGWQLDALRRSRADVETVRREMHELTISHASTSRLRDQLRAERQALEAFGDRMAAMSARASVLDAKMDAVIRQLSLIEEGSHKAALLGQAMAGLDVRIASVEGRVPFVEKIEERIDRLNAVSASVDARLKDQLARRAELEGLQTACGDLLEQAADAQHRLEGVRSMQARLVPLVVEVDRIKHGLETAQSALKDVRCDEAAVADQEKRLADLVAASRTAAAQVAERGRDMQQLVEELAKATSVKDEILAALDLVQCRQRDTVGHMQASEDQLARAEKTLKSFEQRSAHAALNDTKLTAIEARFVDATRVAEEIVKNVQTIVSREPLVRAIKAEVETVHEISAQSKADLAHVVEHRTELTTLKRQVDLLLSRLGETDARLMSFDARSRVVEEVQAKAEAVASLLDEVRATFDLLREQKSVVNQVADETAQLEARLLDARSTMRFIQRQPDLAERIERKVEQLRVPAPDA